MRFAYAAVIAAVVLGVWVFSGTPSEPPVITGAPASTVTTAATDPQTTTTLGSPSTTLPSSSTTVPSAEVSGWHVVGVASDDVLNVRSGPGTEYDIVGSLAHDASDVQITRQGFAVPYGTAWVGVQLADGTTGYASRAFLAPPGIEEVTDVPCTAGQSDGSVTTGTTSGDATAIMAIDAVQGADCTRYVITLGTGGEVLAEAAGLDGAVTVTSGGTRVAVELPSSITDVAEHATTATFERGEVLALSVVPLDLEGLEVRFLHAASRIAGVTVLQNPARIVVDVASAPTGTGLDYGPIGDGTTILEHRIDPTVDQFGVTSPITIVGYGRWFEAQGTAVVTDHLGNSVSDVLWGGPSMNLGAPTDQQIGVFAPWSPTWGEFEIELSLPAGSYKVLIGSECYLDGGETVTTCGATDTFDVAP